MSLFTKLKPSFKTNSKSTNSPASTPEEEVIVRQVSAKQLDQILLEAKTQARQILYEAQNESLEKKSQAEDRARELQMILLQKQEQLDLKESLNAKDIARVQAREQFLESQKQMVSQLKQSIQSHQDEYFKKLQDKSSLEESDVSDQIHQNLKKKLDQFKAQLISVEEQRVEDESDLMIQELFATVIPRGTTNYYAEYTPAIVRVKSYRVINEIKGTQNCNVEFLEKLAKVELVFEDNNVIKINATDSVDREIVRQTLEQLVKTRRINPASIRRTYSQIRDKAQKQMYEAGLNLCKKVGVYNLPKDIIQKLGKFKFRFSFGQNMIEHTLEETLIGISLAHEFGADSNIVRLGCLFHDIGKVIYDDEATHVETGVAYLQKFNLPKEVIDCVAQSHEDEPFSSIESIIVHIADSISGARPAARHNDHEFVNRVKYLEETPKQYKGVKDAYAIQAGREVRVVVDPKQVSDEEIVELAQTLRDRIKNELTYPGSVTVNVIREVQVTTSVTKNAN